MLKRRSKQQQGSLLRDGGHYLAHLGQFRTERGAILPETTLAFETWGELNAAGDNGVLVMHALTGDSHVAASEINPAPGWWEELVGPGKAIDTRRWFVVAPNILGGCAGSTGPASTGPNGQPYGADFPLISVRDSVHAEYQLLQLLGVNRVQAVIGGSLGGDRALEWALCYPELVAGAAVIAANAATTAEQIALAQAQLNAIRLDPNYRGGHYYGHTPPQAGLALARSIAHLSYRCESELAARFDRNPQTGEDPNTGLNQRGGRYAVESYLDHQAQKLVRRFDANSYLSITETLISHDAGRGRGGVEAALVNCPAQFFFAAVTTDRLFFPAQSQQLADYLCQAGRPSKVAMIDSPIGHDGFLTQISQVAAELVDTLGLG